MNIGFLYGQKTYPPGLGGSIHGYQLAKNLVARGHCLFSWYYGRDDNLLIHHFRGRQLLSFLRKIDVLYLRVSWSTSMCRLARLRWLRFRRLPIVWELNGLPEEILYNDGSITDVHEANRKLRRFAKHVDAAIGVTRRIQEYLSRDLGIRRTYCIPNGSDPELFAPQQGKNDASQPLQVVWIGSLSWPWHALDTICQAARILARQKANVEFVIYGRRENLPSNLPSNVTCEGKVPYADLGKKLAAGHVGLHLFKPLPDGEMIDGSPLKLFDYMASGLAVIAQDSGQTGEIIKRSNSGLLTSGSPEDVAEKLTVLERDRSLCRALGENGRRAVVEYYNWDRVTKETELVLNEVMAGS